MKIIVAALFTAWECSWTTQSSKEFNRETELNRNYVELNALDFGLIT